MRDWPREERGVWGMWAKRASHVGSTGSNTLGRDGGGGGSLPPLVVRDGAARVVCLPCSCSFSRSSARSARGRFGRLLASRAGSRAPGRRIARGPVNPVGVVIVGAELKDREPASRVGGASGMATGIGAGGGGLGGSGGGGGVLSSGEGASCSLNGTWLPDSVKVP